MKQTHFIVTIFILILYTTFNQSISAQDTFSIVAVDTLTGQIGSAGASCIDNSAIAGGAIIISDILPGRGAIHTQSYWLSANQVNARNRMLAGDSPQEIIDWLVDNDAQNLPGRRQYGIVDFDEDGKARSAAFTGAQCMDWKGHVLGSTYAIQGNILLSQAIIDSIEARFRRTEGLLSDKLMAALQGANVAGADSRCLNEGVSSRSAFIRMANADDSNGNFYLNLNVPQTAYGVEPIDSLQVLYDEWKMIVGTDNLFNNSSTNWSIHPNPASGSFSYRTAAAASHTLTILNQQGQPVDVLQLHEAAGTIDVKHLPPGTYYLKLSDINATEKIKKLILY